MRIIQRMPKFYWWVRYRIAGNSYGIFPKPYKSEDEANEKAMDKLRGAVQFTIHPLDTNNSQIAARKLRAAIKVGSDYGSRTCGSIAASNPLNNMRSTY